MIDNRRIWFVCAVLALALALALVGCQKAARDAAQPEAKAVGQVVKAHYAKGGPTVDGQANEAFWKRIPASTIPVSGGQQVKLKAAYTDDRIYLTATWSGVRESGALKMWEYDGRSWTTPVGCYPTIGLLWDIDSSIKGFENNGCQGLCHQPSPDRNTWSMGVPVEKAAGATNQRGDLWDVSVSYAELTGLANDFYLGVDQNRARFPGASGSADIVLQPDLFEKKGPFEINGTDKPLYQLKEGLSITEVPYPTVDQLTPIVDYSVFKPGDRVSYFIFDESKISGGKAYGGSRDDIKAKGTWAGGAWTVEIERKLNTGHKDDMAFSPAKQRSYLFAVALKGRSVREFPEMFVSRPLTLRFVTK